MNQDDTFDRQLTTEGQAIQQLAEARLQSLDLATTLEPRLQPPTQVRAPKWPWAMAATVLLGLVVFSLQPESPHQSIDSGPAMPVLAERIKAWPEKLENGIHNPLKAEQAAIIADLKSMKKQWLSI